MTKLPSNVIASDSVATEGYKTLKSKTAASYSNSINI